MSIELRHVTKTFGSFTALRDINLTIPAGELVALLGPSGSGKTTLLRVIAGLEPPNEGGSILFHNQDVAQQGVRHRHVGFVFQHYALFRHLTVFENIAFGLRVRPRHTRPTQEQISAKVRELLRLVQLENLEQRYPGQISGGQRQRVALARALAIEPKMLLLDEPFGALDARVRQDLRRWLRKLHDEIHVTSVFVTHDQEEALEVADRIVVMNQGKIEQIGTPDEVFHHAANDFVMEFLGHVNLFHGRMEQGKFVNSAMTVASAPGSTGPSGPARMFVRPHDLDIHVASAPGGAEAIPGAFRARVLHIHSAGPMVKVEVLNSEGKPVHVELTHERFGAARFAVGDEVFVSARQVKVFVEDYAI